jgi:hypothetical protein
VPPLPISLLVRTNPSAQLVAIYASIRCPVRISSKEPVHEPAAIGDKQTERETDHARRDPEAACTRAPTPDCEWW